MWPTGRVWFVLISWGDRSCPVLGRALANVLVTAAGVRSFFGGDVECVRREKYSRRGFSRLVEFVGLVRLDMSG